MGGRYLLRRFSAVDVDGGFVRIFLVMNLWVDKDARFIRIYGGVVWIYGWSYLYHRWVKRCTTWLA